MVKQKIPHGALTSAVFFTALFLALGSPRTPASYAAAAEAERGTLRGASPVIEGVKARQMGGDTMLVEFRGTKLPLPYEISGSCALTLEWPDTRFPRETDRKAWWDEYSWDVIKACGEKSGEWNQKYDYPLFQRLEASSDGTGGTTMRITAEKPLKIAEIRGMPGSERIILLLKAKERALTAKPARAVKEAGDPLGMHSPVTFELRDAPLKDIFRTLARLRGLNLVLDPSVPDNHMTLSFKDAKLSEVFAYILRINGLSYSLAGKTLVVGSSESIGKASGRARTKEYSIAYADVKKLPAIIEGLIPAAKAPVADERRRTLYITAEPEDHVRIEALLNRIDRPGKQVMLQARLIEVNDNAIQEIESMIAAVYNGWLFSYGSSGLLSEYTYVNGGPADVPAPVGRHEAGLPANTAAMKMLDAGLRAMESSNRGRVLANPSVVALDGQQASIRLTHNYMYQSGIDDNGNPEFEEQETGPTLNITPLIGRDGFITLKLTISTGEIIAFRRSGASEVPETTKREVDTQIRVRNGELFVIGGLYQETKTKNITRVPILGCVPLLGELFKYRSDRHVKSELAFLVVPYILDVPSGEAEVYELPPENLYR